MDEGQFVLKLNLASFAKPKIYRIVNVLEQLIGALSNDFNLFVTSYPSKGIHSHRVACRDRDNSYSGCDPVSGFCPSKGKCQKDAMHLQSKANRSCMAYVCRRL